MPVSSGQQLDLKETKNIIFSDEHSCFVCGKCGAKCLSGKRQKAIKSHTGLLKWKRDHLCEGEESHSPEQLLINKLHVEVQQKDRVISEQKKQLTALKNEVRKLTTKLNNINDQFPVPNGDFTEITWHDLMKKQKWNRGKYGWKHTIKKAIFIYLRHLRDNNILIRTAKTRYALYRSGKWIKYEVRSCVEAILRQMKSDYKSNIAHWQYVFEMAMPNEDEVTWNILGKNSVEEVIIRYDHSAQINKLSMEIAVLKSSKDKGEKHYDAILEKRDKIKELKEEHGMVKEKHSKQTECNLHHEYFILCAEAFDMMMRGRQWMNRDPEYLGTPQKLMYHVDRKIEKALETFQIFKKANRQNDKKVLVL